MSGLLVTTLTLLCIWVSVNTSQCFPSEIIYSSLEGGVNPSAGVRHHSSTDDEDSHLAHGHGEELLISHAVKKKGGVPKGEPSAANTNSKPEASYSIENILALLLSMSSSENGTDELENIPEDILEKILLQIAENLPKTLKENKTRDSLFGQDKVARTSSHIDMVHYPPLQFLEPDLGPAVLPLQVPDGYFIPFIPRHAFGVTNGVARPAHGHASFYRFRPRGLVDVRNSPAFGFLLGGP